MPLAEALPIDDGDIEHEPADRLRDRLHEAAADGDVATTEDLLERIQQRSGWGGEITARTHFDILQTAFEAAVRAGHEATGTACLRAMAQDAELKELARDGMPATLSLGGSRSNDAVVRITPEVLGRRIRHIAEAARAGIVPPGRAAALLQGDGPRPLLRAVLATPDRFGAAEHPTALLESYLKGLLTARLQGAASLSEQAFAKILLAPGGDGQPAIAQCGRDQAAMIRSTLKDALDSGLLRASTVRDILLHLSSAEVDELSGEDAALAWQRFQGSSRF